MIQQVTSPNWWDWDTPQIAVAHQQEWQSSLVEDGIIQLNVESLSGERALEFLLEERVAQLQKVESYCTTETAKLIARYQPIQTGGGGWLARGVDPLNNWNRMSWGQLKPNTPRADTEKDGKFIKYESPIGIPTRSILLDVPDSLKQKILRLHLPYQNRNAFTDSVDLSLPFWQLVVELNLPIVILEGAKKAGCALTCGWCAIALPGIWNGRRAERDGYQQIIATHLIEELQVFATPGRQIIFAFDQDQKRSTRRAVQSAMLETGKLFQAYGCKCFYSEWNSQLGKGVDDLAVQKGLVYLFHQLHNCKPLF